MAGARLVGWLDACGAPPCDLLLWPLIYIIGILFLVAATSYATHTALMLSILLRILCVDTMLALSKQGERGPLRFWQHYVCGKYVFSYTIQLCQYVGCLDAFGLVCCWKMENFPLKVLARFNAIVKRGVVRDAMLTKQISK